MRLTSTEIDTLRESRRTYRNPTQHDAITFLRTSEETGGEYTLLYVLAEPGAWVFKHYHRAFAERFDVLAGALTVELAGRPRMLQPGENAITPTKTVHRWENQSAHPVHFLVELTPGDTGFENGLKILYGLACDGRTRPNGVARNVYHNALFVQLTDIWLPGLLGGFGPLIRLLAARARAKGIEQHLQEQYCR